MWEVSGEPMLDHRRNFPLHQSALSLLIDLFLPRKQWLGHFHQVTSALEHSPLDPMISQPHFFSSSSANVLFNELATTAPVPLRSSSFHQPQSLVSLSLTLCPYFFIFSPAGVSDYFHLFHFSTWNITLGPILCQSDRSTWLETLSVEPLGNLQPTTHTLKWRLHCQTSPPKFYKPSMRIGVLSSIFSQIKWFLLRGKKNPCWVHYIHLSLVGLIMFLSSWCFTAQL